MKRIRIGKDIDVTWSITTNAEEKALDLTRLSVVMVRPDGTRVTMTGVTLQGDNNNVLKFHVGHDDETCLGTYRIELWQDLGKDTQTAVDKLSAWQLVPFTTLEGGYDDSSVETTVTVDLGTSWLTTGGTTLTIFPEAPTDGKIYGRKGLTHTWEEVIADITKDSELSLTSINAVENKVISYKVGTTALDSSFSASTDTGSATLTSAVNELATVLNNVGTYLDLIIGTNTTATD